MSKFPLEIVIIKLAILSPSPVKVAIPTIIPTVPQAHATPSDPDVYKRQRKGWHVKFKILKTPCNLAYNAPVSYTHLVEKVEITCHPTKDSISRTALSFT